MFGSMSVAEEKFDLKKYIEGSMEGLRVQTDAHMSTWGIGNEGTWNVDQDTGQISWIFSDGKLAHAPVQIIGTYNPKDKTFLWGWDHPSVQKPLQQHARLVKEFGAKHNITKFTTQKVKVSEEEAWEFVAVANRLANANGGYRGDAGGPLVFMTYGEITLKQNQP